MNPKIGQSDDPENWNEIHTQVVQSAYEIINLKGYTSWAIGLSVTSIVNSILRNEKRIYALSTLLTVKLKKFYYIQLYVPTIVVGSHKKWFAELRWGSQTENRRE